MADFPSFDLARNLTLASGGFSDAVTNIPGGRYIVVASAGCVLQYLNPDDATYTDAATLAANVPQTLMVGQNATMRLKATANLTSLNCSISGTTTNG